MDTEGKTRMGDDLECKECLGLGKIELIVNGRFTGLIEDCSECNKNDVIINKLSYDSTSR